MQANLCTRPLRFPVVSMEGSSPLCCVFVTIVMPHGSVKIPLWLWLRCLRMTKCFICWCVHSALLKVALLQGNALIKNCNAATDFLDVCSGSAAAAPADMSAMYPAIGTGAVAGPSQSLTLPAIQTGGADASGSYPAGYPANTNSPGVFSQSQNNMIPVAT
jgi:hypothetical protein